MFLKPRSCLLLFNIVKTIRQDGRKIDLLRTQRIEQFTSVESNSNTQSFGVCDRYTEAEQLFILNKINTCTPDELKRYNITEGRLMKLTAHRNKNGYFKSVDELFLMQGLELQIIDKFCKSILKGETEQKLRATNTKNEVLVPPLDEDIRTAIRTYTGIRVYGNSISWARIDNDCKLLQWECHGFEDTPLRDGIIKTVESVANIVSNVPPSDAYIMESDPIIPFARMNSAAYYLQLQRQQIVATIVSLLGTREPMFGGSGEYPNLINNIYMMRSRTPARLFDLLIGTEIVSARCAVKKIIDEKADDSKAIIRIHVDPSVKNSYNSRDIYQQEQMNWSLLLTSAFIDICIFRNFHPKPPQK